MTDSERELIQKTADYLQNCLTAPTREVMLEQIASYIASLRQKLRPEITPIQPDPDSLPDD